MPNLFHPVTIEEAYIGLTRVPDTLYPSRPITEVLDTLQLPTRATEGSAGYDIYSPYNLALYPGDSILISLFTTIELKAGRFLTMVPRSSHGLRGLEVTNKFPVVDSDFYPRSILLGLKNTSTTESFRFEAGDRIAQALIMFHDITDDDLPLGVREGGTGSTGK